MLKLDKSKRYLLACSFGPDSMALFDMLQKENYSFEVAHVNYHLREESNSEEAGLRDYCKIKGVEIHVFQNQASFKSNIEANCREVRYDFFSKLYKEYGFDALLVAHNEDDLIETYLLQKKRKNLVFHYGLAELNEIKGMKVIRPLLSFKKKELLDYCDELSIPYAIDKTNLLPVFERNKIRINTVSKMNDQERKDIVQEIDTKNRELSKTLDKVNAVSNKSGELLELSEIEFAYYLNIKLKELGIIQPITYKQSLEVVKLLKSNKANISLNVARNQAVIYKTYDSLIIEKNDDQFETIFVKEPCVIDNRFLFADLVKEGPERKIKNDDYPLTIRTYQKADRVRISDYEVLVRRLFIDWKMPLHLRKRWPLFVNKDNKIVYIPRYRADFKIENSPNFYVKECFTLK